MEIIENMLKKTITQFLNSEYFLVNIIKKKIEKNGMCITNEQIDEFKKIISNLITSDKLLNINLNLALSSEQEKLFGNINKLTINLLEDDINSEIEEFTRQLADKIPDIIESISPIFLTNLKKRAPSMIKENQKENKYFEKNINKIWGSSLILLEIFIAISLEAGSNFNTKYREEAAKRDDYIFEVLTRLHARACQIALEILLLLKNGYADGAHARWRSLHEIAVVGSFIKYHGNEIAERYLLHNTVESFKAADDIYKKHYKTFRRTNYFSSRI